MSKFTVPVRAALALGVILGTFSSVFADQRILTIPHNTLTPGSLYAAYAAPSQTEPDLAWVSSDTGSPSLYSQAAGGVVITITGSSFSTSPVGPISMSNGVVAFRGIDPAGTNNGVYTTPVGGGNIITITGSNFNDPSGAPVINQSGAVAFKDVTNGKTSLLIASPSSGTTLTIHGDNFSQVSRPAMNNGGDLAFVATPLGTSQPNAYVQPSGGGNLITIFGNNFRMTSSQPKIIDNQKGLLVPFSDSSSNGLEFGTFDPGNSSYSFTPVASTSSPDPLEYSLNSLGDLCVCDGKSVGVIHINNNPILTTLSFIGQPLDGSTITSLTISDSAMLENGNVVFYAGLANGSSDLVYDTVPEPASLAAAPLLLLVLAQRQRKRAIRPCAA